MKFIYNDGGREAAGYKGDTGDCVVRAIAIATQTPYQQVYDELLSRRKTYMLDHNDRVAKNIEARGNSPRHGTARNIYELYLATKGWLFHPTMSIGSGATVHLKAEELPAGRIIARVSKHLTAVIDGVINDTQDCSRNETRCVYGYYTHAQNN